MVTAAGEAGLLGVAHLFLGGGDGGEDFGGSGTAGVGGDFEQGEGVAGAQDGDGGVFVSLGAQDAADFLNGAMLNPGDRLI